MIVCSRCGHEAGPRDRFCQSCGQRFDVNDPDFSEAPVAPAYVRPERPEWDAAYAPESGALGTFAAPAVLEVTDTAAIGRLLVRPISSVDPAAVREYLLDGQNISIGRSPSCDIVLDGDPLTSRRHALFRYNGEQYVLVDLGSSNGTFVNDVEVHEAVTLADGMRILIGEHELVYSTEQPSPAAWVTGAHQRQPSTSPPPKTNPHLLAVGLSADTPHPSATSAAIAPMDPTIPAQRPATLRTGDAGTSSAGDDAQAGAREAAGDSAAVPSVPADASSPGAATSAAAAAAPTAVAVAEPAAVEAGGAVPAADLAGGAVLAADLAGEAVPVAAQPAASPEAARAQLAALAATVDALAQRLADGERRADQRHTALIEARARLSAILSEHERVTTAASAGTRADLAALITVTRHAAEDPCHLDAISQLAEHASDILAVLEERQSRREAPEETLMALSDLRQWLGRQV